MWWLSSSLCCSPAPPIWSIWLQSRTSTTASNSDSTSSPSSTSSPFLWFYTKVTTTTSIPSNTSTGSSSSRWGTSFSLEEPKYTWPRSPIPALTFPTSSYSTRISGYWATSISTTRSTFISVFSAFSPSSCVSSSKFTNTTKWRKCNKLSKIYNPTRTTLPDLNSPAPSV